MWRSGDVWALMKGSWVGVTTRAAIVGRTRAGLVAWLQSQSMANRSGIYMAENVVGRIVGWDAGSLMAVTGECVFFSLASSKKCALIEKLSNQIHSNNHYGWTRGKKPRELTTNCEHEYNGAIVIIATDTVVQTNSSTGQHETTVCIQSIHIFTIPDPILVY